MARLLAFCAFLLGVSYAVAQNTVTATPSTTAGPSSTATPSTTAAPSSTATPSTTAAPPSIATPSTTAVPPLTATPSTISPAPPTPTYNFLLNKTENGTLCARWQGDFTITVTYKNSTTNTSTITLTPYGAKLFAAPLCNASENSRCSFCNNEETHLTIYWNTNTTTNTTTTINATYYLTFMFSHSTESGHKEWSQDNVTFTFIPYNNADFPHYIGNDTNVTMFDGDKLFTTEETRSYQCNSKETFDLSDKGNTSKGNITKASMALQDYRVQAFVFSHNEEFGNAQKCTADLKSSKIVPIAVGAALAGLVVVVLIAYLIGRFKSRKHSSYEALS